MASKAESVDQMHISTVHWSCERFDETGKVNESAGSFNLSAPMHFEEFSKLSVNDINSLIFANVDKAAIESQLEGASA